MGKRSRSKQRVLNAAKFISLRQPRESDSRPQRVTRIKDEETLKLKKLGKRELKARRVADQFIMRERGISQEQFDLVLGSNELVQRQRENLIKQMGVILLEEEQDAEDFKRIMDNQETVELK